MKIGKLHRSGFTLPEMLAVVAIISIILAILMPAVGLGRKVARKARESSAAHQLAAAHINHSVDRLGQLLAGYAIGERGMDQAGNPVTGEPAHRYPWRLMPYLGNTLEGAILVNDQVDYLAQQTAGVPPASVKYMWQYLVSLEPSFGLNYYNVGGDKGNTANNAPGVLTRRQQAHSPSQLIVFGTARMNGMKAGQFIHGFFRITAPTDSPYVWGPAYVYTDWAEKTGNIDPRWDDQAIVSHLDGHVESLGINELRDMRRWSDAAAREGNADWIAP